MRISKALVAVAVVAFAGLAVAFTSPTPGSVPGEREAPAYAPGEILVKFKPEARGEDSQRAKSMLGAERLRLLRSGGEHWRLGEGVSVERALEHLDANPAVQYAEPNYYLHLTGTFPDPSLNPDFPVQWALVNTGQPVGVPAVPGTPDADIDAELAWDLTTGSSSVVVAVIDAGVDHDHVDLNDNMWANPVEADGDPCVDDDGDGFTDNIHGWDFWCPIEDCELVCEGLDLEHCLPCGVRDPFDNSPSGHGTFVAGIIGAEANNGHGGVGVNWDVSIMALKAVPNTYLGSGEDDLLIISAVIEAIEYASDMGADIINLSAGFDFYSQSLYTAMSQAINEGILFTVSVGNSGEDLDDDWEQYPAEFDLDGIIAVAASDPADRAGGNTNYGAISVDLHAPGETIRSTLPGDSYGFGQGSSFAAPHVAGVAALLKAYNPSVSVNDLKTHILAGVDPIPLFSGKTVTGGRLNAYGALQSLIQAGGGDPPGGGPPVYREQP